MRKNRQIDIKIRMRMLSWGKRREREREGKQGRVGGRRTLKGKVNEENAQREKKVGMK